MTDLSEFLLARITEDETHARSCQDWAECGSGAWESTGETYGCPAHPSTSRRIAECNAKRLVVEWAQGLEYGGQEDDVLRLLALPYADHPDYRSEWRP